MDSSMDNSALDKIIQSRHSVRSFSDHAPGKDMIKDIVEAGRLAPYAGLANRGSTDFRKFFVIHRNNSAVYKLRTAAAEAVVAKLAAMPEIDDPRAQPMLAAMRSIADKGLPPWHAPWLIIVAERRGYPAHEMQSLGFCLENMWLKATALNLGMQMVSAINDLNGTEILGEILGINPAEFCCGACLIGYPLTSGRDEPRQEPVLSITWLE